MSTNENSEKLLIDHFASPIGRVALVADEQGRLCALGWTDEHTRMAGQLRAYADRDASTLEERVDPHGLSTAVKDYFSGDLRIIDGLPVRTQGTEFQRAVWRALREIPCGVTWSYAQLAVRIGNPKAVRAVGLANGANPVGIVVPCHRVIGANGMLTGYGGGLERKRWLLAHEGRRISHPLALSS